MHRIHRQVVEVDVRGDEHLGLAVQRQVAELCRDALGVSLDAALAPYDAAGRHYVIDRIDVDLGEVPFEDLEEALTSSLSTAVVQTMNERGLTPGSFVPAGSLGRSLAPDNALLEGIDHFVRTGRLPWWYAIERGRSLEDSLMSLLLPSASDTWRPAANTAPPAAVNAFLGQLRQTLRSSDTARRRLLHQFSPTTIRTLIKLWDAGLHDQIVEASGSIDSFRMYTPLRDALETGVLEAAIDALAQGTGHHVDAAGLLKAAARRVALGLSDDDRSPLNRLGIEIREDLDERVPPAAVSVAADETAAIGGLNIENAGLMLIHPFLPRFMEVLGIARNDALIHPARAALLLHHLATGAVTAEEHELILAKVLCGLPIESSFPQEPPVTETERAEATSLLESVVRHWGALRGTSADGLRGNFLTREGLLAIHDGDWLVRVAPRSYDFMLDSLPWGIAHVKLPWMLRLMRVVWSP